MKLIHFRLNTSFPSFCHYESCFEIAKLLLNEYFAKLHAQKMSLNESMMDLMPTELASAVY